MQFIAKIKSRHRANIVIFLIRCAHFQRLDRVNKALGKGVRHARFHNKAFRRRANLSGILITSGHGRVDSQIQIGIIQNDKRIGAAQLQHAFLQRRARLRANCRTSPNAAGYGHRRDTPIVNRMADAVICRVHPAKDPLRETGIREHLPDKLRRAEHIWRMFKQIAVPCQQDRHRTAQHLPEREVPRHHRQNRPQRTVLNHRIVDLGRFRAQHCRAVFSVPVAKAGGLSHLRTRLPNGLAHLPGDSLRHLFRTATQRRTQIAEFLRPVRHAFVSPLTKTGIRLRNGTFNVTGRCPRVSSQRFAGSRVDRVGMGSR